MMSAFALRDPQRNFSEVFYAHISKSHQKIARRNGPLGFHVRNLTITSLGPRRGWRLSEAFLERKYSMGQYFTAKHAQILCSFPYIFRQESCIRVVALMLYAVPSARDAHQTDTPVLNLKVNAIVMRPKLQKQHSFEFVHRLNNERTSILEPRSLPLWACAKQKGLWTSLSFRAP